MIEKWRSFLAITPGRVVHDRVRALIKDLGPALDEAGQAVRWVHPSKVHLTLRFLGEIPVPLVMSLRDACAPLARSPAFGIEYAGLGAFPRTDRPRVVWLGVRDPSGALGSLEDRLSGILEQHGFAREKRGFTPHVTLGRVRRPAGVDVGPVLESRGEGVLGEEEVVRFIMYRSILDPAGAIHEPVWTVDLATSRRREG